MLFGLVLLICICFHEKLVPIDRMCTATEQTRLKGHTKARTTSLEPECLDAGSTYVYMHLTENRVRCMISLDA